MFSHLIWKWRIWGGNNIFFVDEKCRGANDGRPRGVAAAVFRFSVEVGHQIRKGFHVGVEMGNEEMVILSASAFWLTGTPSDSGDFKLRTKNGFSGCWSNVSASSKAMKRNGLGAVCMEVLENILRLHIS